MLKLKSFHILSKNRMLQRMTNNWKIYMIDTSTTPTNNLLR